jgi:hypothetical protein
MAKVFFLFYFFYSRAFSSGYLGVFHPRSPKAHFWSLDLILRISGLSRFAQATRFSRTEAGCRWLWPEQPA